MHGAGGSIGSHLAKRLKNDGFWIKGVDPKRPEFGKTATDDFVVGDVRDPNICKCVLDPPFHGVYHLPADMGRRSINWIENQVLKYGHVEKTA